MAVTGDMRDSILMTTPIDPTYRLGIDEMDVQHAHWIDLIQKFRSVAEGHLTEKSGILAAQQTLEQLLVYTKKHFASEEKLLAAHKFPGLKAHKEHHHELTEQVNKLLGEITAHRTTTTPLKLNIFVTIWLLEHIVTEDMLYARYILDKK